MQEIEFWRCWKIWDYISSLFKTEFCPFKIRQITAQPAYHLDLDHQPHRGFHRVRSSECFIVHVNTFFTSQQQTVAKPWEALLEFQTNVLPWPLVHLSYAWLALPQFIGACSPKEKSLSYHLQEPAALFSYIALAERTAAPFTFIFLSLREQEVNRSAAFLSLLLTVVENSNICMCKHNPCDFTYSVELWGTTYGTEHSSEVSI